MSEFFDIADKKSRCGSKLRATIAELTSIDFVFTITGICLACFAAFFPWYVFLNQEQFTIQKMSYDKARELPEWDGRIIVNVSPASIPKRDPLQATPQLLPDTITTASISDKSDGSHHFPDGPDYRLLHVINDQALIEDIHGTYMVKVGSILPDDSILSVLEARGDGWMLITSNGDVIRK